MSSDFPWLNLIAVPLLIIADDGRIVARNAASDQLPWLAAPSLLTALPDLPLGVDCPRRIGTTLWALHWRRSEGYWVLTLQREPDGAPSFVELQRMVADRTAVIQAMFDASPLAIAHIIGRTIVDANHAMSALFGYDMQEIRGQTTRILFRSDEEFLEIFRRYDPILRSGQTYRSDYWVVNQQGREFVCNIYGKRLDPADPAKGMIWLYDDVTDRRQAEEDLREGTLRLQQANTALQREMALRQEAESLRKQQEAELARVARLNSLGEMASALAHELSQPLMATTNYLGGCQDLLQSGEFDVNEVLEALAIAIRQNQRAGDIIKHIKQFVRKQSPQRVALQLNQIVTEMVTFTEFEARALGVHVDTHLATPPPQPIGDKIEIEQVVMNLIKNAIEALRSVPAAQRRVTISTRLIDKRVEVAVCDWGDGISADNHARIFEPFFSTRTDGTGFGLAICRSIIKSHGGQLWAEDNPEGGAVFKFTLAQEAT